MFKQGDRVVCIEAFLGKCMISGISAPTGTVFPIKGEIYICDGMPNNRSVYLVGFNQTNIVGERYRFNSEKFRKLDDTFAADVLENIKEQIKEEQLQTV